MMPSFNFPGGRGGHDDPDDRVQRGAGDLQEPQVPGLGPRRTDQHQVRCVYVALARTLRNELQYVELLGWKQNIKAGK